MVAQLWPKCGLKVARMWPEFEIFWPKINLWKFSAAQAQPVPKPQAQDPTRTMKKVARPSPKIYSNFYSLSKRSNSFTFFTWLLKKSHVPLICCHFLLKLFMFI